MKNSKIGFTKKTTFSAVIVLIASFGVGGVIDATAQTAREVATANPTTGGRWLTQKELYSSYVAPYWSMKVFEPANIGRAGMTMCNKSSPAGSIDSCHVADSGLQAYTKAVKYGDGHIPIGLTRLGNSRPNGDYVLLKAYIGDVIYNTDRAKVQLDSDETEIAGCVVTAKTITEASSVATNIGTTLGSSADAKETYGDSSSTGSAVNKEIGATATVGANGLVVNASASISAKVGSTVTSDASNSHEKSTGSSVSNSFTDGKVTTNESIVTTKVPGGYYGSSGQYFPYTEIYGLFRMARAIPLDRTKLTKDKLSNGTTVFRLLENGSDFSSNTALAGSQYGQSAYWFGKITVATNVLSFPGNQGIARVISDLYTTPMGPVAYKRHCAPDLQLKSTIAPYLRPALCKPPHNIKVAC